MISEKSDYVEERSTAVSTCSNKMTRLQNDNQQEARINTLYRLSVLHTSPARLTGKADNESNYGEPVSQRERDQLSG